MSPQSDDVHTGAVKLLRGAAIAIGVVGLGMAVWGLDKWIEVPGARASQFGFQAPLWPAFVVFVLLGTTATIGLLWKAASRFEQGNKSH